MPTIISTHIAKHQSKPIRIQEYATGLFELANTKSAVKKAIKKELLLVDNKPTTTAYIIKGGEKIDLLSPESTSQKRVFDIRLEIVFEDEYLAVIEKPAGVLVSGNAFRTIDNALSQNLQKSTLVNAAKPRPVHRLDFPTTGLLLIGKTTCSIQKLNQLFENKEIAKSYHAITIGQMLEKGTIQYSIDGKSALSTFSKIKTVSSERFSYLNLVELFPSTGRRHQLRKHLSEIGNPILGDQEYGQEGLILKGKGLYLHASSLAFCHPFTAEELLIRSPLPKRFQKIFHKSMF